MKINKITASICLLLVAVFGLALMLIPNEASLVIGVVSGIFTGFIVSVVTSLIGYFNEKSQITYKLQSNIKSLYINMATLKDVTGNILVQIAKTTSLSKLSFDNITSSADLNVELVNDMKLEMYEGFFSNSKLAHICTDFIKYKNKMYNLKNIAAQIEIESLKYDLQMQSLEEQRLRGIMINPQEIEYSESLKNKVNIMTAKLHEYEASLLIELDDLASWFYENKVKKSSWNEVKSSLQCEAKDILSIRN